MADKKNTRDFFSEFKNSRWITYGADQKKEKRVKEEINSKTKNAKKKLKDKDTSGKFFRQVKELKDYLVSGDDFAIKTLIVGGLFYFISPMDLIPDFIPVAGFVDDIAVIGGVYASIKDTLKKNKQKQDTDSKKKSGNTQ